MERNQEKNPNWQNLQNALGERLHLDHLTRVLYATDASVYRKVPLAVAYPHGKSDVVAIVRWCQSESVSMIPRTAGTSLAGQCVGEGLVIDFSRFMTKILEVNTVEKWVVLEPGVIRDELNEFVKKDGLFFGPNTSTANRCMMGGMLGNNSSGTTSIRYGVTRDKVIELEVVLADGSEATLKELNQEELAGLLESTAPEANIINSIIKELSPETVRTEIKERFPKKEIHRRNTGYAIDLLAEMQPFNTNGDSFNPAKLIAGSEGTLCAVTKLKLKLDDLPPSFEAVVCAHFESIHEAMTATVEAMKSEPYACEVMDKTILDLTKGNAEQAENRFFVEGDPGAILCIELRADTQELLQSECSMLIERLKEKELGFAFPIVHAPETLKVWTLRAAGLGVLSNLKGKAKPVAFVEDTAVELADLPEYIVDFEKLMDGFGQKAVYYAHAGAGELHLRPVLDLKAKKGREDFRRIGEASAKLVNKYRGSLSGEHGDGRVRAEFIPEMIGPKNYALLKRIKEIWDPKNIFNPGKIVDPDPMDADFRYEENQRTFNYPTFFDFSEEGGMLSLAEKCNGSGDCRRLPYTGATMCPSYHATRNEKDSTRARANVLREALTQSTHQAFPFDNDEVHEVLDLCISCKACKRECPSSVDMSLLKMESDYHYYRRNGIPKRNKFFGAFHKSAKWGSALAPLSNVLLRIPFFEKVFKSRFGIADQRSIPPLSRKKATTLINPKKTKSPQFVLYIDEFTQYQDAHIAKAAGDFFQQLGYSFAVVYAPSGRAYFSKSLLKEARNCAEVVLQKLDGFISKGLPIIGLEPSGILGFRDEYKRLFTSDKKRAVEKLSSLAFTFEEFVAREISNGAISQQAFTEEKQNIEVHIHCHQKALSSPKYSLEILNFPKNYSAVKIPAGCCGMAGSFGYEEEHFEMSNQIGEQILFPRLRALSDKTLVVAAGTSCRHQIKDGVHKESFHPAEILLKALK
ncbi:FAD-binding and (Fe-S)-binding domain-containing protein [Cryomorphaceae bacterium 1068]|nr:FAD-binding and (Fe-S)-binding domain-containing protein [Cryomorphaceae bacterium 1068]